MAGDTPTTVASDAASDAKKKKGGVLFVRNLDYSTDDASLANFASTIGPVKQAYIVCDRCDACDMASVCCGV